MQKKRQRYILFEYTFPIAIMDLSDKQMIRGIWQSMIRLFGEFHSYFAGLWMVKFNAKEQWGILRCTNQTKERVITSLAFTSDINKIPIIFHTIKTSGTIKKLLKIQKEYFGKYRG
jgi:RNase P/RNase MRP subunit POP5